MKGKLLLLLVTAFTLCDASSETLAEDPLYYGYTDEPDFVIRWKYQELCDHIYDPRVDVWRWPTNEEHGVTFNPQNVRPGDIVFARMIPKFFREMHPRIPCPYILVTAGECLDQMQDSFKEYLDEESVIAWFGVHPNKMAMEHAKFYPLPLGILQDPTHYYKRGRLNQYLKRLRTGTKKKYLLYLNFAAQDTKPERQMLCKYFLGKPYVKRGKRQEFKDYLKQSAESYFVLSPEGLGPDCYRNWEALLCGSIPIVKSSQLDPVFEGLPVLIVDDWMKIDEEFLKKEYTRITSQKYDITRLYTRCWFGKIRAIQKAWREDNA